MASNLDLGLELRTRLLADMALSGQEFEDDGHHQGSRGERKTEGRSGAQPHLEVLRREASLVGDESFNTELWQNRSQTPVRCREFVLRVFHGTDGAVEVLVRVRRGVDLQPAQNVEMLLIKLLGRGDFLHS